MVAWLNNQLPLVKQQLRLEVGNTTSTPILMFSLLTLLLLNKPNNFPYLFKIYTFYVVDVKGRGLPLMKHKCRCYPRVVASEIVSEETDVGDN